MTPEKTILEKTILEKTILEKTILEKGMGVHVDDKLKFSNHTKIQVNKANRILHLIQCWCDILNADSLNTLYGTCKANI